MDNLIEIIKRELTIQFEFYGNYPYARIGWIWILLILFLGYHTFGLSLCVLLGITLIINFLTKR
jgi:hypothetical protein